MDLQKNEVRIAVIDSGINIKHPVFRNYNVSEKSIAIHWRESKIVIDKDVEDCFGHGTAICGILARLAPMAEVVVIKIFDYTDLHAEEMQLISALEYIIREVDCDIVHMSLGIVTQSEILHEKCKQLKSQGKILIAAYDNAGAISYPAAYPEVIGVDSDARCRYTDDFFVVENEEDGNIMVLAKGGNHRLAWTEPLYIISQGSSFSSAYLTAYIAKLIESGCEKDRIIFELKNIAKRKVILAKSE